jgi:hypothetical protein
LFETGNAPGQPDTEVDGTLILDIQAPGTVRKNYVVYDILL